MPAEPMPHIQAEVRAQVAVTPASKFKAKLETTAEVGIPTWEGHGGLRSGTGGCYKSWRFLFIFTL